MMDHSVLEPSPSPAEAMHLVLEDGSEYRGRSSAAAIACTGEVVFNTAMAGYPEALTDPSYAGQILVQTYPLIGNYGVPPDAEDERALGPLQSARVQVQGLVVQQLSRRYSHHLARRSLAEWLREQDVPILSGIDTRSLTQRLREHGTMRGWLFPAAMTLDEAKRSAREIDLREEVFHRVAPAEPIRYAGGEVRVLVVDVGAKNGIIDCLLQRGASVIRAPWHGNIVALARDADAVLIGNGPGDPADLDALAMQIRRLLDDAHRPVFGLCLGHQILARAAGCSTYKLPYGHRGVNQPVQDVITGRCFVTSQNHGYAVDTQRLPPDCDPWFVNLNDRTNEGLRWRDRPVRSVQFHPESRPGPRDTEFLFDDFLRTAGAARASRIS